MTRRAEPCVALLLVSNRERTTEMSTATMEWREMIDRVTALLRERESLDSEVSALRIRLAASRDEARQLRDRAELAERTVAAYEARDTVARRVDEAQFAGWRIEFGADEDQLVQMPNRDGRAIPQWLYGMADAIITHPQPLLLRIRPPEAVPGPVSAASQ
jgi:hypothetical protein